MIVFWRLLLAYYICAVIFYNRRFFAWRDKHRIFAHTLEGVCFAAIAAVLCKSYLSLNWQLADLWPMPGWLGILAIAAVYAVDNRLFVFRAEQKHGYAWTFLAHEIVFLLACLACSPLDVLYHTGDLTAEYGTVCAVGVLIVTKMFNVFVYMVEQDMYHRTELPTLDENALTMLMRLIFFLIMLLPGWRGIIGFFIWFWACGEAHQNRLIDFSRFALYFGAFGATAVGLLVRFSWYWY